MNWLQEITFAYPLVLLLLLGLPVVGWWRHRRADQHYPHLRMPSLSGVEHEESWRTRVRAALPWLRMLALALLVVALARPRLQLVDQQITAEGVDIMLAIDLSSSMLAQDFRPNRLTVSKAVASDFVQRRTHDRLGLVVFAGEAYTRTPLTTDQGVLLYYLDQMTAGLLADGTAIGMGLATAVNRLKDSEARSKVIILLTDGVNNTGYQSPVLAAELAATFGIRIYTVGVGSDGETLAPTSRRADGDYIFGLSRVEIDEELLQQVAELTQGRYFRATSEEELASIYSYIDELEKTKLETTIIQRFDEQFGWFALLALLLLVLEVVLRYSVLRAIP